MTTIQLSPGCKRWEVGDATKYPPDDEAFLRAVAQAGFLAFVGPSGLCGGKARNRTVLAIHRGRGTNWEIVFRENDSDVVTTTTTDFSRMMITMVAWLGGSALTAAENSLHAVAG